MKANLPLKSTDQKGHKINYLSLIAAQVDDIRIHLIS